MNEIRVLSESERNWAMFCHLSTFASVIIPFGGIIGPLICWSSKRHESSFVDMNGKEALNFQLSILLYLFVCIPLIFIVIGIVLMIALFILELVCVIIASIKAARGEDYRYPLSIPFIQ
ncbi:MAG TPA: DUF4870 domain-containing protein [Bacteroidales bacterium]|nr:DUF4870 domain-containing protein [Bacteroidales bacterium]